MVDIKHKMKLLQVILSSIIAVVLSFGTELTQKEPCIPVEPCLDTISIKQGESCICCINCSQYNRNKGEKQCPMTWQDCGNCKTGFKALNSNALHEYCVSDVPSGGEPSPAAPFPAPAKVNEISAIGNWTILPIACVTILCVPMLVFFIFIRKKVNITDMFKPSAPPEEIPMREFGKTNEETLEVTIDSEINPLFRAMSSRPAEEQGYDDINATYHGLTAEMNCINEDLPAYQRLLSDENYSRAVPIDVTENNAFATFDQHNFPSHENIANSNNIIPNQAQSISGNTANIDFHDHPSVPNVSTAFDSAYETLSTTNHESWNSASSTSGSTVGYSTASTVLAHDDEPEPTATEENNNDKKFSDEKNHVEFSFELKLKVNPSS